MIGYIDTLPALPPGVSTGDEVSRFYEEKHKFTEVSLFTKGRFERAINHTNCTPAEKERL
jgi:hypothetical protein